MSKHIVSALLLMSILIFTSCRKEQAKNTGDNTLTTQTVASSINPSLLHEDEVLTPGGWRPKTKVALVENGHHLSGADNRLRKIDNLNGKVISDYGVVENKGGNAPDYPGNVNVPAHRILPLGSGWITYTYWSNPSSTPISYFNTNWVVPPAPSTNSGQTIFIFNGLQNSSYILQPVLQWGPSAAGGGNYWAIANWYVDGSNGTALFSNLIPVNPGTNLQGIMTLTGTSGSHYNYTSAFAGYPAITLTVNNIAKLYWAAESLEAYGVSTCTDYPATSKTRLSAIELRVGSAQAPLSWHAVNAVTDCGQHATIVTPGTPNGIVDLYY
ncbi:hypothetical protein CLV51_10591 [Chitinophaga niastensis]|uniref:Uncharacterized protein n=1 Tax=Chitinophaga niastensis TaxID=536980 RepID=A0A2P8HES1_CHINA|nr:hypothetical protein [Chitinophaga niastensis]PSL44719.1 hypothetical protein CLV51_10591 [Chitinophaga niastensis]